MPQAYEKTIKVHSNCDKARFKDLNANDCLVVLKADKLNKFCAPHNTGCLQLRCDKDTIGSREQYKPIRTV